LRSHLYTALAALLASLSCGCFALPFGTPPMRVTVGGGARWTLPPPPEQRGRVIDSVFQLRAGIDPLQFTRAPRTADIGVGYLFETGKSLTLHGAYVEGTVFPIVTDQSRVGVHLMPRFLYDPDSGRAGGGMGMQLSLEAYKFTSDSFSSSSNKGFVFGVAHGEGGIGLYLEGSYTRLGTTTLGTLGGGLTIRIPSSVGVAVGWR